MNQKISKLVESAIFLALAFLLSYTKIFRMPLGGSVTLVSMLPIVLLGYKYGPKWGLLCGSVHAVLQLIEGGGMSVPPISTFYYYILVFILDYGFAFGLIGFFAGLVSKLLYPNPNTIIYASIAGISARFVCSFLSGIIIWQSYTPEGQNPFIYSAIYNASYLIPEIIISAIIAKLLLSIKVINERFRPINSIQ